MISRPAEVSHVIHQLTRIYDTAHRIHDTLCSSFFYQRVISPNYLTLGLQLEYVSLEDVVMLFPKPGQLLLRGIEAKGQVERCLHIRMPKVP